MGFVDDVEKNWKIEITSKDLYLENPTKEELLDLITASIPYREISSQVVRLTVHVIKIQIYSKETTSWKRTIDDAVSEIRSLNLRRKSSGEYHSLEEMREMMQTKWSSILSWVADESAGRWKVSELKRKVHQNETWVKVKEILSKKPKSRSP